MSAEAGPGGRATSHDSYSRDQPRSWWRSRTGLVTLGFIVVAGYFLITEHTAHVLGILPWLLLAACPLMHLFMHHGHHGGHDRSGGSPTSPEEKP